MFRRNTLILPRHHAPDKYDRQTATLLAIEKSLRRRSFVSGDLAADIVQVVLLYRQALALLGVDLNRNGKPEAS